MSNAPLPSSFDGDTDFYEESRWQKFSRRLVEEPLIPFGCALTCYALLGATRSIRSGDHTKTNRMFRFRIYAQGFTLVAMVLGSMYYQKDRDKRKKFEGAVAERKAMEKKQAWIRELEIRDEEDKLTNLRRDAVRIAAKEGVKQGLKESRVDSVLEERERKSIGVLAAVRELLQR
ncbi:MAG: Respiratory supercomplex factor 1, mitochondrial [Caeruleum heppii]|nr:MAG: Respiratory supercomplex factor 1, mitochondrial [Caeruleum heppii]